MIRISQTWTKHLKTEDERKEFQSTLLSDEVILKRLRDIIKQELDSCNRQVLDKGRYALPNWAEFQADSTGEKRALTKILKLITLEKNHDR